MSIESVFISFILTFFYSIRFNKPEYIARARQNKLNRQAGESATHTGGSITHSSHAKLMVRFLR